MGISNGSGSPGPFKPGQKSIDSGMLNQMWSSMKSNQPGIHGSGLLARKTPGGTLIDPVPGLRKQPISLPPFWVTLSSDGKITFKPGMVSNIVPLINGKPIDEIPAPTLSLPTGAQKNYMVVVKCYGEKNKRFPKDNTEILIVTSSEANKDTDDYGYLAIASLTKIVSSDEKVSWAVNQLVQGSVWAERRKLTEPNSAFYYFSRV
jgi:hypothetical protein